MLRVLMYLFESFMGNQPMLVLEKNELNAALARVGFQHAEIGQALEWLEEFISLKDRVAKQPVLHATSMRIYSDEEKEKIPVECRGMLVFLEENGILNPSMREMVIDRLMSLHGYQVDLPDVKWVTLMVLFYHPEQKSALSLMQDLVLHGDVVH